MIKSKIDATGGSGISDWRRRCCLLRRRRSAIRDFLGVAFGEPCPYSARAVSPKVNAGERRAVLGMDIGANEAETFWTGFMRNLARPGLRGEKFVVSDARAGVKARLRARSAAFAAGSCSFQNGKALFVSEHGPPHRSVLRQSTP